VCPNLTQSEPRSRLTRTRSASGAISAAVGRAALLVVNADEANLSRKLSKLSYRRATRDSGSGTAPSLRRVLVAWAYRGGGRSAADRAPVSWAEAAACCAAPSGPAARDRDATPDADPGTSTARTPDADPERRPPPPRRPASRRPPRRLPRPRQECVRVDDPGRCRLQRQFQSLCNLASI
jgi:hypothetical protein